MTVYNYDTNDKAVELKANGTVDAHSVISGYDSMSWYAGSLDFKDPIDYAIYDSASSGCICTELAKFYPVNYTNLAGGINAPSLVESSYLYPCSSCYMSLLMRVKNCFVEEGVKVKTGIDEDYD